MAELLIAHGADVNAGIPISSGTDLQRAAYNGTINVAKVLIAHGAKMNVLDWEGKSVLKIAQMKDEHSDQDDETLKRKAEVEKLLLAHGAK